MLRKRDMVSEKNLLGNGTWTTTLPHGHRRPYGAEKLLRKVAATVELAIAEMFCWNGLLGYRYEVSACLNSYAACTWSVLREHCGYTVRRWRYRVTTCVDMVVYANKARHVLVKRRSNACKILEDGDKCCVRGTWEAAGIFPDLPLIESDSVKSH